LFEKQILQPGFSNFTEQLINLVKDRPEVAHDLLKSQKFTNFLEYLVFDFKPRVAEKDATKKLI
jgi:hypothetical protein